MKKRSYGALIFFLILGLMTLGRVAAKRGSGFAFRNIDSSLEMRQEWEISYSAETSHAIKTILGQPFFYLGNSPYTYEFLSEDRRYILKFFKMKHLLPKRWSSPEKNEKCALKLDRIFMGYRKKAETIFIHLNKTKNLKQRAILRDKKQKWHRIDLDAVPFILLKHYTLAISNDGGNDAKNF